MVGGDRGRADHDLGAVGAEERDLLRGHLVRHDEDAPVAAPGGHDREADPGVARGSLDDRRTRASSRPWRSASSIIAIAGRSFTLPPGLSSSSLASSWHGQVPSRSCRAGPAGSRPPGRAASRPPPSADP